MNRLRRIYWTLRITLYALRWFWGYHLGTEVWHRGHRGWTLVQGVCRPVWTLQCGDHRVEAHERAFRKVHTFANHWHGVRYGFRFYHGYWLDIWERKGVEPWMRELSIWGGPRNG